MSEDGAAEKKSKLSPSLAILLSGVLIAGAIIFVNEHPAATQAAAEAAVTTPSPLTVPAPSGSDHIVGSPTAPIVMIEYSDFECPYCQLIYPELKDIVNNSNGQVAWVMRDFPLYQIHPQAESSANAAECIAGQLGNKGWWEFTDTIFADQTKMAPGYYRTLAQQFGANMTQYDSCIAASTYQSKIDTDEAQAESAGGQGTPFTIIYNTKTHLSVPVSGAVPEAQIEAAIKEVQ